ncbi:vegetative incompatibility protein HET-E-1 [Cladorrhinum samala]|uniref:Vegetative incompatibility protein HET-E-1 n=1 Tax=Cladorrhinum samala TaxID=585594 RepID=A0AAV9HMY7_9PEZI|nr:vegetative incompatibility protein HET-E-1 [Cladorrhinum samala]
MRLLTAIPATPDDPLTSLHIKTEEYFDSDRPAYAILSHTWLAKTEELTLQELQNPFPNTHAKIGFHKTQRTCELALSRDNLTHAWVDTCCIDKTSSAELAEAINSMYAWYVEAEVCYVYLSDLPSNSELSDSLSKCRWFTRGWTLQELIAPKDVVFFDQEWNERGNKQELSKLIFEITGIPESLLKNEAAPSYFSVACRMSWAARRITTRIEDAAYCLMGIFNVNMSLRYGEKEAAFVRLQEEILRKQADMSIFVWVDDAASGFREYAPVLADSARQFRDCGDVKTELEDTIYRDPVISSRGVQLTAGLIHIPENTNPAYLCILEVRCRKGNMEIGVALRKISGGRYARYQTGLIPPLGENHENQRSLDISGVFIESLHLATSLPPRFPFHPTDPVLGNRHRVLKFRWDKSFSMRQAKPMPRSHWDLHDQVFFCSNSNSTSWGGFFIHGRLDKTPQTFIPVDFFVTCHRWNIGKPHVYLGNLSDLKLETVMLMEVQLDNTRFESNRQAETVVWGVLDGTKIEDQTLVIETGTVETRAVPTSPAKSETVTGRLGVIAIQGIGETGTAQTAWHSRFPQSKDRVLVKISVQISEQWCRELCVANPVILVDVQFEIVEQGKAWKEEVMVNQGG